MKNKLFSIATLFSLIITLFFSAPAKAAPSITVFAAASLTGPLTEIINEFTDASGIAVKVNFASSGNLTRQIEQGAPADIFLSASRQWMDYALKKELIDSKTRIEPIQNSIVLISPAGTPLINVLFEKDFEFPSAFNGKFSIGDPEHVPAGKYAKQSLEYLGWWEGLKPRLIRAKDVRQALMIVEYGEVEAGTVFGSDAYKSEKVQVIGEFPEQMHSPIVYAAAVCASTKEPEASKKFLDYLMNEKSQKIFLNYGFKAIK